MLDLLQYSPTYPESQTNYLMKSKKKKKFTFNGIHLIWRIKEKKKNKVNVT